MKYFIFFLWCTCALGFEWDFAKRTREFLSKTQQEPFDPTIKAKPQRYRNIHDNDNKTLAYIDNENRQITYIGDSCHRVVEILVGVLDESATKCATTVEALNKLKKKK